MAKKFLLIYRGPRPSEMTPHSPADMQKMMASWGAWKAKFTDAIVEMGDALHDTGKLLSSSGVTDGPLVESKEIIGGYFIVNAADYHEAVALCDDYPDYDNGGTVIVRQLQKMDMPS